LDLVILGGDLTYAYSDNNTTESRNDEWGRMMQPITAYLPLMTAPGNHEAGDRDFIPYINRWAKGNPSKGGFWYSFDYGVTHFLSMSTEHPYEVGSDQYNFIKNDLITASEKKQKNETKFIIVFGHRPMYSTATHGSDVDLRDSLETIFAKYSVDIACWGHDHIYQRTYPVYNSATNTTSKDWYSNLRGQIIHTVVGNSGRSLYQHSAFDPTWSAYRESQFGLSYFNITYDGILTWRYYRTDNLTLRDEFTLVNTEYKGIYASSLTGVEIFF